MKLFSRKKKVSYGWLELQRVLDELRRSAALRATIQETSNRLLEAQRRSVQAKRRKANSAMLERRRRREAALAAATAPRYEPPLAAIYGQHPGHLVRQKIDPTGKRRPGNLVKFH